MSAIERRLEEIMNKLLNRENPGAGTSMWSHFLWVAREGRKEREQGRVKGDEQQKRHFLS